MNNLHISLTEFCNESRVLKQTRSIIDHNIANKVYVAALHNDSLSEEEMIYYNIELKRFKLSTRKFAKSLLIQLLKYVEFVIRVTGYYRKKGISMVNVHSLALLPLGVLLKYWYGAKLIYDTHELETETNNNQGLRKKLATWVERFFIRFADQTFVVSKAIAQEYVRMYNMPVPPVILNCPNYTPRIESDLLRKNLGIPKDATIFLYQGGLSEGRGVHIILESFIKMNNPNRVVVFMGYGPLEEEIKKASKAFANIYYHPAVAPDVVLNYTASSDVGFTFYENTCLNHYYCMPNKLFEYMMAGLPVIVSNMYEMSRFVKEHGIGIVAKKESVEGIMAAIDELMQVDLAIMKQNALKTTKYYSWEEQEKIMIATYKKLFDGGKQ